MNNRNIIFIMLDTVRADVLKPYGGQADVPNMGRLASDGVKYNMARLNPSYASVFYVASALNKLGAGKSSAARTMKAKEIMHRHIISIKPSASVYDAIELFKDHDFPQLPVLDESKRVVGTVYQKDLLNDAMHNPDMVRRRSVGSVMKASLPQIDGNADIAGLKPILESNGGVIVVDKGKAVGIITVYDVLKTV